MKDLNFLPQYLLIERKQKDSKNLSTILILSFFFAIIVLVVIPVFQVIALQKTSDGLNNQIGNLQSDKNKKAELDETKNSNSTRENAKKVIEKNEDLHINAFNTIQKSMPLNVSSANVTVSAKGDAQVIGIAADRMAVADLIHNLRETHDFNDIFVASFGEPDSVNKSVQFALKLKIIKKAETQN